MLYNIRSGYDKLLYFHNTVKGRYSAVQYFTDNACTTAVTEAEHQSEPALTKDIPPHSSPMRASYGVSSQYFGENWPRYHGTALYFVATLIFHCFIWYIRYIAINLSHGWFRRCVLHFLGWRSLTGCYCVCFVFVSLSPPTVKPLV